MKLIEILSVDELIKNINTLPNHYIYRGQANSSWSLQSSLERVVGVNWSSDNAQKFECFSLDRFQSKFHLYDTENCQPVSKLAWLAAMQHYGVPTRLIDFSESPYVALYFALEAFDYAANSCFSIYLFDYRAIMERSMQYIKSMDRDFVETRDTIQGRQDEIFDQVVDRFSYDIAWITEPKILNARIDRQAGSFLLSGNKGRKIEDILSSDLYKGVDMQKMIIPFELATGVYSLLRKMNVTGRSLYGDLGGLAKSIRMEVQAYSVD
ncbi:FRG domain-containing protein [Alcaligenes faecalis]|uniref:FRG domain-containing protein n=1 Tax=Alcaligenes faecalis TaxID=511 RepID=A0A2U2BK47_ALCFA|nr:FRG domain-containing protein [Alcaligenes faecalis]PWE14394.1 FRG domain-containing protein [Alcaligenes faecalis]RSE58376.1 FRG domain-containing protein [Alcaligenes faecalis]